MYILKKWASKLANRLLEGANALTQFAEGLSEDEWKTPVIGDGRTIGVVVHHVANVYPLEVELAQLLVNGNPITEATKDAIDEMNADHAKEFALVGKQETIDLLKRNSGNAAEVVKNFYR